ncbi:MAG: CtsR family transcriptional regulator [Clostridia bacterium]|jgi:transcriptional regulator CtsR|nr:CtsR family transcriptional regulator [Clostridia bacterium]
MRISDLVAEYIKNILDESNGTAEIQRNELANNIGCVPSQINYVISSRFTQENGYVVESRRGGGGYIRITRVHLTTEKGGIIMHVVNSVGETLDETSANFILENLISGNIIQKDTARIISAGISEKAFSQIPKELRNNVRSTVFKNMLLTQV